jgi:hypothetical protein
MRRVVWAIAITLIVLLVAAVTTANVWPALWQTIWSFLYDYRWWWALPAAVAAAAVLLWLVVRLLQRPWGAPWRAHVLAAADALQYQLEALPAGPHAERHLRDAVSRAVQHHLEVARTAAWPEEKNRLPVAEQFLDWWTGAPIEVAYVNLHEAEIALAQLLPDDQTQARIPEALARLQTMDVTDPRRRAAETQLAPNASLSPNQRRAAFQTAVRIGLELKDQTHERLRGFRNVVLTTAAGLMVLVVALCVAGAWKPDAVPLCFGPPPSTAEGEPPPPIQGPVGVACPSEERPPTPGTQPRRLPAPGDVTLIALLGLLGGGLSNAIAIRGLQGTSTPYDVPVALSLLKLPSGALTALVGLLFVRGQFVPGLSQLDNQPQILAYAFLFGISQQLFTRLVDRQAQDILGKVPSKEPVSAKPEPPPAEAPTQALGQPERPRRLSRRSRRQRD